MEQIKIFYFVLSRTE